MFDEKLARARRAARPTEVELVSMPWTALNEPSLGLGILSAVLAGAGFSARVRHLNLSFLRFLQVGTYTAIADSFALNDFLFTHVLDPVISTRQWGWLRAKAGDLVAGGRVVGPDGPMSTDEVVDGLLDLRRNRIPAWLETQAGILAGSPARLIGFTCMFDQTIASVALARLIKERAPEKLVALGGYAVREPTGGAVLRAFPWVDAICTGEGETTVVELTRAAHGGATLERVPGLAYREPGGAGVRVNPPPPMTNLAAIPTPDFDDYYLDIADLAVTEQVEIDVPRLPVENSRGCWWGEIRHCVFCGIHDDDLGYRSKPAEAALRTMDELADRYGMRTFRFSDYIMPRSYFTTLLPELIARGAPYQLTTEMKANVNADDFGLLVKAGFAEVQPGIESFSSAALRAMDKGTSAAQNAQTLLLGKAAGVQVHWNLLYGFPGDDADDYEAMLDTLARLTHLDPPASRLLVQVTRYAPLQVDPGRFGIAVAPYEPCYDIIFSPTYLAETGFDLGEYCYYFARPFQNSVRLQRLYQRIDTLVDRWRRTALEREVVLEWRGDATRLVVTDSRTDPAGVEVMLGETESRLLLALRTPRTVTGLVRHGLDLTLQQIEAGLSTLDAHRLVLRDGSRWLSLVLPATCETRSERWQLTNVLREPALDLEDLQHQSEPQPAPAA
jgi:ribosomal peptide maturation radical SAM protein 1